MLAKKLETDSAIPRPEDSSVAFIIGAMSFFCAGTFRLHAPVLAKLFASILIGSGTLRLHVPVRAELLASIRIGSCSFTGRRAHNAFSKHFTIPCARASPNC